YVSRTLTNDAVPILMVTNGRVLYTERELVRGWVIAAESAARQVTGASYERRWLTGRIHVDGHEGSRITCKVRLGQQDVEWSQYMVTLIQQLTTGRRSTGY